MTVGGNAGEAIFADYLDGESARTQRVKINLENVPFEHLRIELADDQPPVLWPAPELRSIPDQADRSQLILGRAGDHPARVIIADSKLIKRLSRICPDLKRPNKTPNLARRVTILSAAAVASVALIVFVLVPIMADQLAIVLPEDGERALGDSTFEQIRTALAKNDELGLPLCEEQDGREALIKMLARLDPEAASSDRIRLHVLNHEMVNAFALPGGHIVLFRGLLDEAESADEVAGVLSHEIGHVVRRDPTRLALRSAGSIGVLGLLFGDFAGGIAVLYLAEKLIQAHYSRGAEAASDEYAHVLLAEAELPTAPFARFFLRLKEEHGSDESLLSHLASHPDLQGRADAAMAVNTVSGEYEPVLTQAEWDALQHICQ